MRVPPPPRRDRFTAFLVLGVALILAVLVVTGAKSVRQLSAAHQRERGLDAAIAAAERRVEDVEVELELLASDPATLEGLARDELGMVRPDELVILFPRRGPAAPPGSGEVTATGEQDRDSVSPP